MTQEKLKRLVSAIAALTPLADELPDFHVDENNIIWNVLGTDLYYGFALEILGGAEINLQSVQQKNKLIEALRAFIKSIDEETNVQVIYDRRPINKRELSTFLSLKDPRHASLIGHKVVEFFLQEVEKERALRESVYIIFRYPLNEALYRPFSIFKRVDPKRTEEAIRTLLLRREAVVNQLRGIGILVKHLDSDAIRRVFLDTFNPDRARSGAWGEDTGLSEE